MSILALLIGLLKIIGIILALILFIICVILFSNINLKIIANNNNKIYYFIKISYILGLFIYIFDNEKNISCFKILGINIRKNKKIKVDKENISLSSNEEDFEKNKIEKSKINENIYTNINEKDKENIEDNTDDTNINNNKNNIKESLFNFKKILNYPNKKEIISSTILLIKRLIKCIKFKKIKINIDYGLNEPFKTGSICGIISTIIPFLPKKYIKDINIMPDFEKEIFLADVKIKCKTSFIKILLPIIIFISKKSIRKIIFGKGE